MARSAAPAVNAGVSGLLPVFPMTAGSNRYLMSADVSGENPVRSDATRLKRSLNGLVCHACRSLSHFAPGDTNVCAGPCRMFLTHRRFSPEKNTG